MVFFFVGFCVGNCVFKDCFIEFGVKVFCVVNKYDVVFCVFGWYIFEDIFKLVYIYVGVLLIFKDEDLKYLNYDKVVVWFFENFFDFNYDFIVFVLYYNLEVYLYLIDGYGCYDKFLFRDFIFVNKLCGFFKDDKYVLEVWW